MDDNEYYAKMREQYQHHAAVKAKPKAKPQYKDWADTHGREDAEMLNERERGKESEMQPGE